MASDEILIPGEELTEASPDNDEPTIQVLEQPLEIRLRYDPRTGPTQEHQRILSRLNARLDLSYQQMRQRSAQWDELDKYLRLYVDASYPRKPTTADGTGEDKRRLIIPVSLAILQVRTVQMWGMYAARAPLFAIKGIGPEDVEPAKYIEAAIHYDTEQSNAAAQLYMFFFDAERYGSAWIGDWWEEKYGWKRVPPSTFEMMMYKMATAAGMNVPPPKGRREWQLLCEHNAIEAKDPRLMYPDPRVPLSEPDAGEFIGEKDFQTYLALLEKSQENGGPYFNLDAVKKMRLGSISGDDRATTRARRRAIGDPLETMNLAYTSDPDDAVGIIPIEHIRIKLVPRDWELGDSEKPEIWWFTIADEKVIIRAHRSAYDHNSFGYSYAESQFDTHSIGNPSSIETLLPLQKAMDWLFNSHFENIRRALNNVLIYAPTLIEEEDLLNPGPMQHIRLSRLGEQLVMSGQLQPQAAVQQLPITDITSPHLQAMQQIFDMIQRVAATSDPQMSSTTPAKRTLGEIQAMMQSSSQRLTALARLIDLTAIRPMVRRLISNRLQFTQLPQWVGLTGDMAEKAGLKQILITPSNIVGSYDYELLDTQAENDPARQSEAWSLFMQAAGTLYKFPGFGVPDQNGFVFNIKKAFKEFAKVLGVRNVDAFFTQVAPSPMAGPAQIQVVPDEEAVQMAERGDAIPQ
jgi:hypothetical protein